LLAQLERSLFVEHLPQPHAPAEAEGMPVQRRIDIPAANRAAGPIDEPDRKVEFTLRLYPLQRCRSPPGAILHPLVFLVPIDSRNITTGGTRQCATHSSTTE
jgi:hypothetical protein